MSVSRLGNGLGRRRFAPVALAAAIFAALLVATPLYAVTVNVDVGAVRATLPLEGLGMGTAVYANQFSNSQLDERLNEAGVTTLRYSGGGYADVYHWSEHKDSPFGGTSDRGYVASATTFPGLLNIMNNMGNGQAVVTVNYGSALKLNASGTSTLAPDFGGQPQEAAAWVAYANGDASIFGTGADKTIGSNIKLPDGVTPDPAARFDQQGNDWRTIGFWAKLRASKPGVAPGGDPDPMDYYSNWATPLGMYDSGYNFLAINRDATVGVKYWEIGNETFGTGYYGGGNGYSTDYHQIYNGTNRDDNPNLSAEHYGDQVVAFAQMMKEVDPTIKTGTVLATPPDDYTWSYADLNDNGSKGASEPYWNDAVLDHAKSETDFVMVHWYPYAGEAWKTFTDTMWNGQPLNGQFNYTDSNGNFRYDPGEPSEPVTSVNEGDTLVDFPRQKINRMINGTTAGADTGTNAGIRDTLAAKLIPDAEIMVTEFNYFGNLWTGAPQDPTNYAPAAFSLFVADSYASWLETGVKSVQLLELSKDEFVGDQGSLTRGSAFYAIQMLNYMADPGDEAVTLTSSSNSVRVHSALQDDGTVAVMILNMNESTASVDITINGDTLSEDGTLYSTTGIGITTTPMSGLGNSFSVANMPGRTNYLFLIPTLPPPLVLLGDYNDDVVVDAADYTVWRNNVGDSDETDLNGNGDNMNGVDQGDYDLWLAHYGDTPMPGGGGISSAVPEPSAIGLALVALAALSGQRSLAVRKRSDELSC